jgi:hypothetical protein
MVAQASKETENGWYLCQSEGSAVQEWYHMILMRSATQGVEKVVVLQKVVE